MGILAAPRLVVKRTFLEFVDGSPKARPRSLTDSALNVFFEASSLSEAGASPSVDPSAAAAAAPEDASSDSTVNVNKTATEELKAFLGLGLGESTPENSPAFLPSQCSKALPVLPALQEEQAASMAYWADDSMQTYAAFHAQGGCWQWEPTWQQQEDPTWAAQQEDPTWAATMQLSPSGKVAKAADAYANSEDTPENLRTTVIMRNIPNNYTRDMLLDLLDSEGFACRYDFVYIPVDFNSQAGLGYAFVDLVSPEWAQEFWKYFEGFRNWMLPSEKVCTLNWSAPLQGFEAHVERYRNSPVMHESMPEEWKPVIFLEGERLIFPPPTKPIKAPKIRSRPKGNHATY